MANRINRDKDQNTWGTPLSSGLGFAASTTPQTPAVVAATQVAQAANEAQNQAIASKTIPPPPLQGTLEINGNVSPEWAFWFTQMWRRSGGSVAPSTNDLSILSVYGDDPYRSGQALGLVEDVELLNMASEPRHIRMIDLPLSSQLAEYLALVGDTSPRQFALTGDVTKPYNGTTTTLANIPSGATDQLGTTLGDMSYWSAAGVRARLAGSTSATLAVLTQTGNGAASAAPAWVLTTGTGNVVRATSPTLVTPVLGTPTSGTLSNCTTTTQSAADNSTKLASTAYVDRTPGNVTKTATAPTGTTSTTAVMMGIAASITPSKTGNIIINIAGEIANNTAGDGAIVDLRTGTGSAPANGDPVTGTLRGVQQQMTSISGSQKSGFGFPVIITGLALGTAIWIDLSLKAVTAGTASVSGVNLAAHEF